MYSWEHGSLFINYYLFNYLKRNFYLYEIWMLTLATRNRGVAFSSTTHCFRLCNVAPNKSVWYAKFKTIESLSSANEIYLHLMSSFDMHNSSQSDYGINDTNCRLTTEWLFCSNMTLLLIIKIVNVVISYTMTSRDMTSVLDIACMTIPVLQATFTAQNHPIVCFYTWLEYVI